MCNVNTPAHITSQTYKNKHLGHVYLLYLYIIHSVRQASQPQKRNSFRLLSDRALHTHVPKLCFHIYKLRKIIQCCFSFLFAGKWKTSYNKHHDHHHHHQHHISCAVLRIILETFLYIYFQVFASLSRTYSYIQVS